MTIAFAADVEPIFEAMGVIDGITAGIDTDIYSDIVLNYAISEIKLQFNAMFTAASLSNPRKYHHVWEWGEIGVNPLYYLIKSGKGKRKTVSFGFRQSLKAVPKPDAAETGIPQENIDRLKRRSIFRMKAIIMETGTAVHIRPKRAQVLFVPTPGATNKQGERVNFLFRKSVTLRNVGGETTGMFSAYWTAFWRSEAPFIMEEKVLPAVERTIANTTNKELATVRRGTGSRYKTFTVQPMSANEAAHRARAKAAETELTTYANTFLHDDWEDEE